MGAGIGLDRDLDPVDFPDIFRSDNPAGGTFGDQLPVLDQDQARTKAGSDVQVVEGSNDRTVGTELAEQFADLDLITDIEMRDRLI